MNKGARQMKKRLLSLFLTASLALTLALPALAAAPRVSETEAAQVLAALEIMSGDPDGSLRLDDTLSRAELATMAIMASVHAGKVGDSAGVKPYPDVAQDAWYAPFVELARDKGLVGGYTDGTFRPENPITLAETASIILSLLGYQSSDFSGLWPSGQMAVFRSLDLDRGVSAGQDQPIVRRDALYIFYHLLTAKTKTGQVYLTTLGHSVTADGKIDRVALINSTMEGPIVAGESWETSVGFSAQRATVYRGDLLSTPDAIRSDDLLYWSAPLKTVWAYSDKITGVIQALSPSASSPRTVTLSGRSYSIETADAAYALSSLGSFRVGDPVTLLLGREGGAAAVLSPEEASATLYGVVTSVTEAPAVDPNGNSYTAKTLSLTAVDGKSYSFPVEPVAKWEAGDLVQVICSGGGYQFTALKSSSLSGKVDAAGSGVGTIPFAANVQILDVKDAQAICVRPSRLAGARLEGGDVSFCRKNTAGEIDILILKDFTGDLLSYAVLTEVKETETPGVLGGLSTLSGSYTYDVGGISYTCRTQNLLFNQPEGPVVIEGSLYSPTHIRSLPGEKLASLDAFSAVTVSGTTLPVWENAVVYELQNGVYRLSSLERVRTGYTLTGYSDASPLRGGQIRIIVAQ